MTLDAAREHLATALGGADRQVVAPIAVSGDRERVVLVSDFHAPFTRLDVFARLCRERADRLVIMGDVDDGYAGSTYTKYERVPYTKSLAYAKALLERTAEAFPKVDIIEGNHDLRLEKRLREQLDADIVDAIKVLARGSLSPLKAITENLPNVTLVGTKVEQFDVRWFYQLCDLLVCHADKYSSVPGRTLTVLHKWFSSMRRQLGLKPFRVLAQAHTHQLTWVPLEADQLGLEVGCCCDVQEYMLAPACTGVPQRHGYVTLDMVKDKVEIESIRLHWLD